VNSNIRFFSEEIKFTLKHKIKTKKWLTGVIRAENKSLKDISYIFCSDEYLLQLNQKYLRHNTLTDILTFPDPSDPEKLSGEIYISVIRVKENSENYLQLFDIELARVMVHGILHLLGYNDKTPEEKEIMTRKENHYLEKHKSI
jgi:probable rRNA maturation factor